MVTLNKILNILLIGIIAFYIGRYFYMQPAFVNGAKAPIFAATTMNGQSFSLDDLKGKYVLIDFWGSWCGPCRQENPGLVELYHYYKQQSFKDGNGFEIVSIGIEKNPDRWKKAIASDEMVWPYHILDQNTNMKFFNSEIAQLYEIKQLPTKYLLNPEGVIVAVNPGKNKIERVLKGAMR